MRCLDQSPRGAPHKESDSLQIHALIGFTFTTNAYSALAPQGSSYLTPCKLYTHTTRCMRVHLTPNPAARSTGIGFCVFVPFGILGIEIVTVPVHVRILRFRSNFYTHTQGLWFLKLNQFAPCSIHFHIHVRAFRLRGPPALLTSL